MLNSLNLVNLTVFPKAALEFSPQLNVIVGENGTGKTHPLKVPYSVLAASAEEKRRMPPREKSPSRSSGASMLTPRPTERE